MPELVQFSAVTVDRITLAYSGRRGCTCGCRGKWYEDNTAQKKRILTTLRKAADEGADVQIHENRLKGGWVVGLDTEKRCYVLHVT